METTYPSRKWVIVTAAALIATLACTAPNQTSVEQTASAGQATLAAQVTVSYGQLTPRDIEVTDVASTVMAVYVQQTLAAQATQVAIQPFGPTITAAPGQPTAITPTATDALSPTPSTGTITGKVCYPAGGIPPLTIYAMPLPGGGVVGLDNPANVDRYSISVPVGNYTVFAYPTIPFDPSDSLVGGYTQAVPCGLDVSCTDHTLIEVAVHGGETTSGVDVCDWYNTYGVLPARP